MSETIDTAFLVAKPLPSTIFERDLIKYEYTNLESDELFVIKNIFMFFIEHMLNFPEDKKMSILLGGSREYNFDILRQLIGIKAFATFYYMKRRKKEVKGWCGSPFITSCNVFDDHIEVSWNKDVAVKMSEYFKKHIKIQITMQDIVISFISAYKEVLHETGLFEGGCE